MDTTALLLLCTSTLTSDLAALLLLQQRQQNGRHARVSGIKRNKDGRLRKPRRCNIDRHRSLANRQKLQQLQPKVFGNGMRMERDRFEQLLAKIEPILESQRSRRRKLPRAYRKYDNNVDPYIALAFTLCWLGGARRWDLCYMFDVASTTLHVWIWRVIPALVRVLRDNVHFPTSRAGLDALAAGFANIGGGLGAAIPNTVCAFDGVVVQKCPPPQQKLLAGGTVRSNTAAHYYRKGYFGAAVMAFVDAKCRFLSVSMACAASCHDTTQYDCSAAGRLLAAGLVDSKYIAVGDEAFVTAGHVLTPYKGHSLTPQEDAFNYYLSLQRQVVERTFAIWKRKWGIFWRSLCVSEVHVKQIIIVTCHLHNFCIDRNVSPDIDDYIDHNDRYWLAVKPQAIRHHRLQEPPECRDAVLLHVAERAPFLPDVFVNGVQERCKRKAICDSIAQQGLTRPPPRELPQFAPLIRGSANLPAPAAGMLQ